MLLCMKTTFGVSGGANLQLSTRDEQLDVLAKVLSAGEDEAGIEVAPVGDDIMRTKAALAQRTTGNLAALSGAHGLTYMEVQAATDCSCRTCKFFCQPWVCEGLDMQWQTSPLRWVLLRKQDTLWHAATLWVASALSLYHNAHLALVLQLAAAVYHHVQKALRCNLTWVVSEIACFEATWPACCHWLRRKLLVCSMACSGRSPG